MKFHFFTAPFSLQFKFPLIESFVFCPGGRPTLIEALRLLPGRVFCLKKDVIVLQNMGKLSLYLFTYKDWYRTYRRQSQSARLSKGWVCPCFW